MKETLLILGVDTSSKYALSYAKSTGAMTIITDYNPMDAHPVKQMADEVWTVDVKDLDVLEQRCLENQVTGIYAGNSEFCLDMAKKLAQRLNLPFYATDMGWACSRDKAKFKACCMEVGLDVPKQYHLDVPLDAAALPEIKYPVMVKPVDACAQKGMSLCRNAEELSRAVDKALMCSRRKEITVEEYIEGIEVAFFYILMDGNPVLVEVHNSHFISFGGRPTFSFIEYQYDCEDYQEKLEEKVKALFQKMNCEKGAAFLQAICRDGKYYFFEMNYRVEGLSTCETDKRAKGYSRVEYMVDLALGRDVSEKNAMLRQVLAYHNGVAGGYFTLANAGKIKKIIGLDEVKAIDGIELTLERYHEGDEIKASNDMLQIAYYIGIWAEDKARMIEKVRTINHKLHILDESGKELFVPFEEYDALM